MSVRCYIRGCFWIICSPVELRVHQGLLSPIELFSLGLSLKLNIFKFMSVYYIHMGNCQQMETSKNVFTIKYSLSVYSEQFCEVGADVRF